MNVLVSGVASDIGMGIGRILRTLPWVDTLYGMDIRSDHSGEFVFDYCAKAPKANDANYLEWLSNYIHQNDINLFIPSSEAEISKIVNEDLNNISGALIITTNAFVIQNSLDKHQCLNLLASNGISVPKHGLVKYDVPDEFPVIVKPRSGQGSKNILKITTKERYLSILDENLVWQDYLEPDNQEYTCPVFYSEETGLRILIIKRELQGGFTNKGEIIQNKEIFEYVSSIANAMKLNGLMNIQLRLTDDGPKIFEINPRLSSTLVFRDKMGFRDLIWLLEQRLGKQISEYEPPKPGTRFYRGIQEYITNY